MSSLYRLYQALLRVELWAIVAAVLAGMLWEPALIAAPLIGLLFALLRLAVEKKLPGPTPADLAILLLFLLLPVNYLFSANPDQAITPILRLLGGVALYYAVVRWAGTLDRMRKLVTITSVAALGLCTLAVISIDWVSYKLFFIPPQLYERLPVLTSDTIHPNVLAGSLIAIIPLAFAMLLYNFSQSSIFERFIYSGTVIMSVGVLLLTQSRAAILALLLVLLILLFMRSRWAWYLPLVGLLAGLGMALWLGMVEVRYLLNNFLSLAGLGQRLDIWQRMLYMLQDFPLSGVGMGNFAEAFRVLYPMSLEASYPLPHAHNLFLQVGADLGIPGLIVWLAILLAAFFAALQAYRTGKRWQQGRLIAISAGLLGCQLAIILHGTFDSVLWAEVRTAPLVWWLWGLAMASLNLVSQARRQRASRILSRPKGVSSSTL